MSISFPVDDVTPCLDALPTEPLATALAAHVGARLFQTSHEAPLVSGGAGGHFAIHSPLVAAVHRAFAEHRPLVLSPDAIWLTISQGFAYHVDLNAEALRQRFVRHEGRAVIEVSVAAMPERPDEWAAVIARFGAGVAAHVGPGLHRLLLCDFSTTTPIARTASEVVMTSAFRRYFDYRMVCICGIPSVTLEGTPDDWRRIRERIEILCEYDLAWWIAALRPVCDQLVATAEGRPDREFWRAIYMPAETYGSRLATGWLARLFPYLRSETGEVRERNTILASCMAAEPGPPDASGALASRPAPAPPPAARRGLLARLRDRLAATKPQAEARRAQEPRSQWTNDGLRLSEFPSGVSATPFTVSIVDGVEDGAGPRPLRLFGGFVGVRQRPDGALLPEIGWAVGDADPLVALLDRVRREKTTTPQPPAPVAGSGAARRYDDEERPADLVAFDDQIGGVTLFGRARVRARGERVTVIAPPEGFLGLGPDSVYRGAGYDPSKDLVVTSLCDFSDDPRWIGMDQDSLRFVLIDPRVPRRGEEIPVVAEQLRDLLAALLAHQGQASALLFAGPGFRPVGTLRSRPRSGAR